MAEAKKRGRGRPAGFKMPEEHRTKIANSKIFKRLIEHAEGTTEMTPTQVQVGLALMKKILPDLSSVEHTGNPDNPIDMIHTIQLVAGGKQD